MTKVPAFLVQKNTPKRKTASLEEDYKVIVKGVKILRKWAKKYKMNNISFVKAYFSKEIKPPMTEKEVAAINAIDTIKDRVACENLPLVAHLVKSYIKSYGVREKDFNDLFGHASLTLAKCIYTYHGTKSFKYYLRTAVINDINGWCRCYYNGFNHISRESLALVKEIQVHLTFRNYEIDEEQAMNEMSFLTKERKLARKAMRSTACLSQLSTEDAQEYHRKLIVMSPEREIENYELAELLRKAIDSCPLTPMERECLERSIDGGYGWQVEVANKYINPHTGKRYSNKSIIKEGGILDRARKKVLMYYNKKVA